MSAARADEYVDFCTEIQRLCRIDLSQYKRGQMERRIRTFAERRQMRRLSDYAKVLKAEPAELEAFLDRITINVSQLWRNPEQWEVLGRAVLPELARDGRIRAWSAGSSYGAEAYTLAAVAAESVPRTSVTIRGTDIDVRMWSGPGRANSPPPTSATRPRRFSRNGSRRPTKGGEPRTRCAASCASSRATCCGCA